MAKTFHYNKYRVVQLDLKPVIDVLYLLFDRYVKQHTISGVKSSWTTLYEDIIWEVKSKAKESMFWAEELGHTAHDTDDATPRRAVRSLIDSNLSLFLSPPLLSDWK